MLKAVTAGDAKALTPMSSPVSAIPACCGAGNHISAGARDRGSGDARGELVALQFSVVTTLSRTA